MAMSQRTSGFLARGPRDIKRRHSFTYAEKEASYYGPEFLNVEKGRSSSFSSPRRVPAEPNAYEKRPHPYPPMVEKDYQNYKNCEKDPKNIKFKESMRELRSINNEVDAKSHREALMHGLASLCLVNDAAMSRSAFMEKYSQAYRKNRQQSHLNTIKNRLSQASNIRLRLEKIKRRLLIHEQKDQKQPLNGLSKSEWIALHSRKLGE